MKHFVLISCVSAKLAEPAPAARLYVSPLFRLGLAYARSLQPDDIYVLSAKLGLVALDDVIEPYEQTLNSMPANARRTWSARVADELRSKAFADFERDEFTFLAGERYRSGLVPLLKHVRVPMHRLGIGQQLRFLSQAAERANGHVTLPKRH